MGSRLLGVVTSYPIRVPFPALREHAMSTDQASLAAVPDGQLVVEVLEALQISKSTACKYEGALGI